MEDLGQSLCLAQLGIRRKRPHKLDVTPHRVACCHACERIGVIVLLTVQELEGAHRTPPAGAGDMELRECTMVRFPSVFRPAVPKCADV